MFMLALEWSMNKVIFHIDLPGTVLVHACCIGVVINCPLHSQKCPGLDSKLCGHIKSKLSWRRIKLKEAREASWKSAALIYTSEKGTETKPVFEDMQQNWRAFCSTTTNYSYLDVALSTIVLCYDSVLICLFFQFNLIFLKGKSYIFKLCFSSESSAMLSTNCLLNKYILIWINTIFTVHLERELIEKRPW